MATVLSLTPGLPVSVGASSVSHVPRTARLANTIKGQMRRTSPTQSHHLPLCWDLHFSPWMLIVVVVLVLK